MYCQVRSLYKLPIHDTLCVPSVTMSYIKIFVLIMDKYRKESNTLMLVTQTRNKQEPKKLINRHVHKC